MFCWRYSSKYRYILCVRKKLKTHNKHCPLYECKYFSYFELCKEKLNMILCMTVCTESHCNNNQYYVKSLQYIKQILNKNIHKIIEHLIIFKLYSITKYLTNIIRVHIFNSIHNVVVIFFFFIKINKPWHVVKVIKAIKRFCPKRVDLILEVLVNHSNTFLSKPWLKVYPKSLVTIASVTSFHIRPKTTNLNGHETLYKCHYIFDNWK